MVKILAAFRGPVSVTRITCAESVLETEAGKLLWFYVSESFCGNVSESFCGGVSESSCGGVSESLITAAYPSHSLTAHPSHSLAAYRMLGRVRVTAPRAESPPPPDSDT